MNREEIIKDWFERKDVFCKKFDAFNTFMKELDPVIDRVMIRDCLNALTRQMPPALNLDGDAQPVTADDPCKWNNYTMGLKIVPRFLDDIKAGRKTFEVRRADRQFEVGINLRLYGWNDETKRATGDDVTVRVVYVLHHADFPAGIEEGFCVLGIERIQGL